MWYTQCKQYNRYDRFQTVRHGQLRHSLGVALASGILLVAFTLTTSLGAQVSRKVGVTAPISGAGWLGLSLLTQEDDGPGSESPASVVVTVEPGSPAQIAGLVAGDTIVELGGVDIRNTARVLALQRDLRPGQRILVKYRRNGVRDVQLTAAPAPRQFTVPNVEYTVRPGDIGILPRLAPNSGALAFSICDEVPFAGAQVKAMNSDLAEVLGVKNMGVIVLSIAPGTPARQSGLRPGDVIVKADTAVVENAETIIRAMRSASDRSVMLSIMRKGKPQRIPLRW